MWTTKAKIDWLTGLGIAVPLFDGADNPERWATIDRVGVVTPTTGPGLSMEGAADTSGFQLRLRGGPGDPDDAERLALDADQRILFSGFPTTIGDIYLLAVFRSGARPTPVSPTPDNGGRTEYVCTYLTRVMHL